MDENVQLAKYAQIVLDKAEGRPVFIFGAGEFGGKALGWFPKNMVTGFIDNNVARAGTTFSGIKVYTPSEAMQLHPQPFVLVASVVLDFIAGMCDDCIRYGYRFITYQDVAVQANNDISGLWEDKESVAVYASLARLMKSRRLSDLPAKTEPQYFQPFIPKEYFRSVVDGGAYIGDTYLQCTQQYANGVERYYAFEPDGRAFERLLACTNDDARVQAFHAALSNVTGRLHFLQGKQAYGSRLSPTGGTVVDCIPLDDAILNMPPTFIKLDVEGAEPEALAGAAETIVKYNPALAVCVYHDPFHLWTIPQIIRELMPKAKLYLRHHSNDRRETVCYAVP